MQGILILIGRNKTVIPVRSSRDHIGMQEFGLGDCTKDFWNLFNFDLSYDDYDPII